MVILKSSLERSLSYGNEVYNAFFFKVSCSKNDIYLIAEKNIFRKKTQKEVDCLAV